MTVCEIRNLTKYLNQQIAEEIKSKLQKEEMLLINSDYEEEEKIQILNTLYAILVLEKLLECEQEEIEESRLELEQELIESYEIYNLHKNKRKKEKKKKRLMELWLLNEKNKNISRIIGGVNKTNNPYIETNVPLEHKQKREKTKEINGKNIETKYDKISNVTNNDYKISQYKKDLLKELVKEKMKTEQENKSEREIKPMIRKQKVIEKINEPNKIIKIKIESTDTELVISEGGQKQRNDNKQVSIRRM